MQNIERELSIRSDEVNSVIAFLKLMDNGDLEYRTEVHGLTMVKTSIKAGIVLMLYNAVESTMTKCLERLHEILINRNLRFSDCNDNLKKLVVVYYENAADKSPDNHSKAPYILRFCDYLNGNTNFELSYAELSKYYPLYSGNLDSRSIISVLGKYGIDFQERATELKTIKDNRNQLAHGERSFEEVGRDISLQQIEQMKAQTFEYLNKIIAGIKAFISEEKYKNNHT